MPVLHRVAAARDISPTDAARPRRWPEGAATALVASTFLYLISFTVADPDLWGHLKFGQDIVRARQVARTDAYSYLSGDVPWINHEWATEAIFWSVFDAAGPVGLMTLKIGLGLAIFAILYRHLVRAGLTPVRSGILVLVAHPLLAPWFLVVRPHLFTFLLLLLLLLELQAADRGRSRWLWTVPLLMAVWANLHGGYLAGVGVLLAWGATHAWRRDDAPGLRTVALTVLASLLATFLNPYGPKLLAFLLRTATVARPFITEWQPIQVRSLGGLAYVAFCAVCGLGLAYSRRRRLPLQVVLFGCLALLPLFAVRHAPLFAIAAVALVGEHVGDAWERWLPARGSTGSRGLATGITAFSVLASLGLFSAAIVRAGCIRTEVGGRALYPVGAVEYLRRAAVRGNLAVHFGWGEYVIWHLGPRVKVSVDGRRETVYSEAVDQENLRFYRGGKDWDALLRTRPTQLALVRAEDAAYNLLLREPGWRLVYSDDSSGLFARTPGPGDALVASVAGHTTPAQPGCFP